MELRFSAQENAWVFGAGAGFIHRARRRQIPTARGSYWNLQALVLELLDAFTHDFRYVRAQNCILTKAIKL
jgi:hypothetical protein